MGADGSFIFSRFDPGTAKYLLQAGAAQGISRHSTFGVHESNLIADPQYSNNSKGTLVANHVNAFTSELVIPLGEPPFKVPPRFYAKLIQRGDEGIAVFSNNQTWLQTVLNQEFCTRSSVRRTQSAEDALLHLLLDDDNQVIFERHDSMAAPYIGHWFPQPTGQTHKDNVTLIQSVVRGYSHFYYHLMRTGDDFKAVSVEFNELKVRPGDDDVLEPIDHTLVEDNTTLSVEVDEDATFGMTIISHEDVSLYPYVFCFDPSTLEIG